MNSTGKKNNFSRIAEVEHIIEKLLHHDEVFWQQRSRVNWLKNGDRNTKFFHALTKNEIDGFMNSNGDWCSDMQGMTDTTFEYFSSLFSSSNPIPEDMEKVLKFSAPVVDSHMNSFLCSPFYRRKG